MQEEIKPNPRPAVTLADIAADDSRNFVDAFVWLVKQDKKQNPALYQRKQTNND
jgi:hypothetical protein